MAINRTRVRDAVGEFDFEKLFVEELGWDRAASSTLDIEVSKTAYVVRQIAHKRGMVAFLCEAGEAIPNHSLRRKIDQEVAKSAHEHILIFVDSAHSSQVWQWIRREPGKPAALRQHVYYKDQSGQPLIQRLESIAFSLDEEESLTISGVAGRARQAFDIDRVTKRFYERFASEHKAFLDFIKGIQSQGDREWYASLMLNRLMFTYFIQKKGFLDGDIDYLRNRLGAMRNTAGDDKFHSFYRYFLLRLFHEGLGQLDHLPDLDALLGKVPYLNGGLFDVHVLEKANTEIEIPDEAFERVFDFFDSYQWNLDERPLRADNEINPDVLGYIFEKYINQKQMGAYYTKEDITGYMTRNTVLPFLLDRIRDSAGSMIFGETMPSVWSLLSADPDRYIYAPLRHGYGLPLPDEISMGVNPKTIDAAVSGGAVETLQLRRHWNRPADSDFALPTETWREVVARHARYEDLRARLTSSALDDVADLITLNIDLLQLAQDVIENCEEPEVVRAFWSAINSITILDPACGSGAFLFAALNILEPLYEACLDRMESFQAASDSTFSDFGDVLNRVRVHPNRRYFIFKSIILNNLFGVDIMEEAVEICKLRLFLKLAAQVDPDPAESNFGIEPLPDIDFNIRPGNSLVGFATYEEVESSIAAKFDFHDALTRISANATELQSAFDEFRDRQIEGEGSSAAGHKPELRKRLEDLQGELNRYLADEFGVDAKDPDSFATWLNSHQPFHWFVEFYGIMSQGGFDVVIGNPPYVEYSQVSKTYTILDQETKALGNLHAMMTKRSLMVLGKHGCMSMIVPVALPSTARFEGLRRELLTGRDGWVSHFDFRPAKLFEGAEQRLTIFILRPSAQSVLYSTRYNRWYGSQRATLFPCLAYASTSQTERGCPGSRGS